MGEISRLEKEVKMAHEEAEDAHADLKVGIGFAAYLYIFLITLGVF